MDLNEILTAAIQKGASDIFIIAGIPVTYKIKGVQDRYGDSIMNPDDINSVIDEIYVTGRRARTNLDMNNDDDFSFSIRDLGRFRVNIFRQRGSLAAVIRVIRFGIPDPEALGIPESVLSLADNRTGLVLVTGAAGFIGSNLVKRLFKDVKDATIVGIDNMNDYYDVALKEYRLKELEAGVPTGTTWIFIKGDIADKAAIDGIFEEYKPQVVVNLAAQAGVRYSITNPDAYIQSNLIGFYNILEACRHWPVEHLVYASSSSVYGSNKKVPYSTDDKVDNPVSLYAATKKSNELLAHAYSKLYNIPSTGLRFFTVYGPAGRPDMAYFGFTNKLRKGETIQIFNYGNCMRDFTYVDDIVEGVVRIMQGAPEKKNGEDGLPLPPYAVYNIGNSSPENLLNFVDILQQELIRAGVLPEDYDFEAHKQLVPMQPGDVPVTFADTMPLERDYGFRPSTPLRQGLRAFAEWYVEFYK